MKADRTEQNDLADQNPGEVQTMVQQWRRWSKEVGAMPKPPAKSKAKKKAKK